MEYKKTLPQKLAWFLVTICLLTISTACISMSSDPSQALVSIRPRPVPCKMPAGRPSGQQWGNSNPLTDATTLDMASQNLSASPHIQIIHRHPPAQADMQRANILLQDIRNNLSKYLDYCRAVRDGYTLIAPAVQQDVYHFVNLHYRSRSNTMQLDTLNPAALLYVKVDGIYQLIGAMYTAPATLSERQLDLLFPGSVIPWHRHINYCLPRVQAGQLHSASSSSQKSVLAATTAAACSKAGGVFAPHPFDWMIQIYAFGE